MRKDTGKGSEIIDAIRPQIPKAKLRNPFTLLTEHVSRGEALHIEALRERKEHLRLALVSLPELTVSIESYQLSDQEFTFQTERDACRRQLLKLADQDERQLLQDYRAALGQAINELGANIICINELGFPTYRQRPRMGVADETWKLANHRDAFILAGTYHDPKTYYNTGRVFYPGSPRSGVQYHKQVSAASIEELISVPPNRSALLSSVSGLWVGALICLDLADYSSVAAVVNFRKRCDLLLVPAYTEYTDSLRKIATATSKAMMGIVAMVNYHTTDLALPEFVVRIFGEKAEVETHDVPGGRGRIGIVDVKVNDFKEQQRQRRNDMDASSKEGMEWLFGNRTQSLTLR